MNDARQHFEVLGVRVTAMAADEMAASIAADQMTYRQMGRCLEELENTLRRELRLTKLLILQPKEHGYWEPEGALFGPAVDVWFPSTAFELEEAAKCMALGRYTASVFHLMRIMEIGLSAMGKALGIPDPVKDSDRNWGKVLERIKAELERRGKLAEGWDDPNDKGLFRDIYASLDAVRTAWRNSTMHVENKYTADEAEHIFGAVKGLMRKIAERFDEDGDPTMSGWAPSETVDMFSPEDVDDPELMAATGLPPSMAQRVAEYEAKEAATDAGKD